MSELAKMILRLDVENPGDPEASFDVPAEFWAELVALARAEEPRKPYRVAILACSKSKLPVVARPSQLYTGELFRASLAVAERLADRFLVLSAKHGVLTNDVHIEPYDETLPTEKHRRAHWGNRVAEALQREFGVKDRTNIAACDEIGRGVLCLAPQSYVSAIGFMYGKSSWAMPLKGLGIGQQKAKLKEMAGGAP